MLLLGSLLLQKDYRVNTQEIAFNEWEDGLARGGAALASHPGTICAGILIKLLLDLWLHNPASLSFPLALVMLHRQVWHITDTSTCPACSRHLYFRLYSHFWAELLFSSSSARPDFTVPNWQRLKHKK